MVDFRMKCRLTGTCQGDHIGPAFHEPLVKLPQYFIHWRKRAAGDGPVRRSAHFAIKAVKGTGFVRD
jgi:hypothetical protein